MYDACHLSATCTILRAEAPTDTPCVAAHYHAGGSGAGTSAVKVRGHVQLPVLVSVAEIGSEHQAEGSKDAVFACSEVIAPVVTSITDAVPVVALVQRGGCDFATKARNVLKAGYSALVVVNSVPDQPPMPPALFTDPGVLSQNVCYLNIQHMSVICWCCCSQT